MNLGCGLFGLAYELDQDFNGTLKNLSKCGFTAIEPLYSFPNDPALMPGSPLPSFLRTVMWNEEKTLALIPELNEIGLSISSMHVGFLFGKDLREGCEELVHFAGKSGITHFMTSLEFDTEAKMHDAADLMNKAAEYLSGTNVTLGYHNHAMEFGVYDNGTLMDEFIRETSSAVKLQLDVGWQMYGGSDVITFMKKYSGRIISVHLKDFVRDFRTVPQDDAFAAIGDGPLPTEDILAMLDDLDLMENGLMIDQDKPAAGATLSADLCKGASWLKEHITRE